ncbi:MAG: class I SAM-dependent rRNA methyltransferase [Planctomycetes bacterium]|nr:class I SAM-dependent rRNA methyltransferase [Planctomycetota bacterium]MBI3836246.1 class I SAM-dependent rRNA methyltransferase [Planctomycetota bacterium]
MSEQPTKPEFQSPWVHLRSATYHPFIYSRMIREVDRAAKQGDVVNVYDKAGILFGRGLFNPRSMIAVRMLVHGDRAVDEGFWQSAIGQAIELRRRHKIEEQTDAYRLVHAEGDGLSGLILERYADVLVFEAFSVGMYQRVDMLARIAGELLGPPTILERVPRRVQPGHDSTPLNPPLARGEPAPGQIGSVENRSTIWRIVSRVDDNVERLEGFRSKPRASPSIENLIIREHGIRYRVDVEGGQKTGFFCDQRENRLRFSKFCEGSSVLDLCCYTGGFGLAAKVLGKANEVTSVDLDESALEIAKSNANLNQVRISHVHSDVFPYLRQMIANGRQFDAVVLDPPKLALTRDDYEDAVHKYQDLNQLALQVVRPGGFFVTCSCSGLVSSEAFMEVVMRAARWVRVNLQLIDRTGPGPDHPVMLNCPESSYLKVLWFRRIS